MTNNEMADEEFNIWDKDPKRNPYVQDVGGEIDSGAYDNADEVETAFKAGFASALSHLQEQKINVTNARD